MAKHGNKIQRSILIPPDLDREIADYAQREVRTYNEQLEYMLIKAKTIYHVAGTQMDVAALGNRELLEKMR